MLKRGGGFGGLRVSGYLPGRGTSGGFNRVGDEP